MWKDFKLAEPAKIGDNFAVNRINYTITGLTPATVAVGNNTAFVGAATIPATVINNGNTYAVTSIAMRAFQGAGMVSATIPNSVTNIGAEAFRDCNSLNSVTIPNSVTSISTGAFRNCTALRTVNVSWSTAIPNITDQFANVVTSSVTLNIPVGTLTIYRAANGWKDFAIVEQLRVGNQFIVNNVNYLITNLNPNTVAVGSNRTFVGNAAIPASVRDSAFSNYAVTAVSESAFNSNTTLNTITLPNSVLSIGASAFFECSNLTTVTIPSSVTTIASVAFRGCFHLATINVSWATPPTIPFDCFTNVLLENVTLNIPFGTLANYQAVNVWRNFRLVEQQRVGDTFAVDGINYVITVLPNQVGVGSNSTISGAAVIRASVERGGNSFTVTSVQSRAFDNNRNLTSITLPSSITNINLGAFSWCDNLTTMTLGSVTPPIVEGSAFDFANIDSKTLIVPVGTRPTYIITNPWRFFGSVVEPCTPPTITASTPAGRCGTGSVTISAVSSAGSVRWFTTAAGSTALATGAMYNISGNTLTINNLTTTTTFFAEAINGASCVSTARTAVVAAINTPPLAPVIEAQSFCDAATVANLNTFSGTNVKWYSSNSATVPLAPTTALTTASYFASQTNATGCESVSRTEVVVTLLTTTWAGNTWSNGVPDATKTAIFTSSYNANSSLTACAVVVSGDDANVVFPSNFNLTVTNGITVAEKSSLTFENNSNLIQTSATAVNSGNITYRRNASMKRLDYVYWSSPVAGQKLLAFSPNTLPNRFYTFNEPTNAFVQVESPATTNFDASKGYSLRAPNNHSATLSNFNGVFTGVPNNGNFVVPVTRTASPQDDLGYNLLGNPYPSPINGTTFLTANTGSVYFWTHQSFFNASGVLQNGGAANYATMSLAGSVAAGRAATVSGGTNITPNGTIQAGQGFMFLTTTNKNVTFTNVMREGNNADQFFKTAQTAENNKLWLNLSNNSGVFSQTMIAYLPNTTTGFDDGYDAKQINTSGNVLSSQLADADYAIQSRGSFDSSDVVQLNLNIATAGSYTLSKDNTNGIFSNNQDFFLRDNLTGITHNIKQTPYIFVTDAGAIANRFSVVYQNGTLSNNANVFENANVIVFEQNGTLNISATEDLQNVKVFDIQGRNIFEVNSINAKTTTLTNFSAKQQVLMVQITNANNEVITKKVIF